MRYIHNMSMHIIKGITVVPKKSKSKKLTKNQEYDLEVYNKQRKKQNLPPVQSLEAAKREDKIPAGTLSFSMKLPPGREMPKINSINTNTDPNATAYKSHLDPRNLAKEKPEVAAETIAKSKRVAILANKSSYQYIDDGVDPTCLGSSERRK
jgi:hypothetical protein